MAHLVRKMRPDRRPGPGRTTALAELIWFRSLTGPHHVYVESAGGDRQVTYGELRRAVAAWMTLLDDLRVPSGAIVGLAVSDPIDFSLAFLGVIASGRIAGPLDPGATDAELATVCGRIEPALVVSDRAAPRGAAADWLTVPSDAIALVQPDGLATSHAGPFEVAAELRPPAAGGLVLSTSGTSGAPKLIRLGEDQLLHTAASVAAGHALSVADRGFCPLPLFHINAEVVGLLAPLTAGASVVLDARFHRTKFWDLMAWHRITWINAVPAILARLVPLSPGERVPPGIRFARSASAPLPLPVLERFERQTGIPVVETYGMTEAASQIAANPIDGPRKPGSVGRPVGTEVRVTPTGAGTDGAGTDGAGADGVGPDGVGPDGVGTDGVGRVEIRGSGVISSYASPGYEDRVDAHGWLDTGDLGYLDADGYLFLVGRADDVINRGGEKIWPHEVEDVLLTDPSVAEAAVVGWDHEVLGRVPVAYVVVNGVTGPGDRPAAQEVVRRLQERCAAELSRPKRPVAFHVVERLPQGATGKVRRREVGDGSTIYSLLAE